MYVTEYGGLQVIRQGPQLADLGHLIPESLFGYGYAGFGVVESIAPAPHGRAEPVPPQAQARALVLRRVHSGAIRMLAGTPARSLGIASIERAHSLRIVESTALRQVKSQSVQGATV